MKRIALRLTIVASVIALAACADTTAPTTPQAVKSAPTKVSQSRYMLASGRRPPAGCTDLGDGWMECPW